MSTIKCRQCQTELKTVAYVDESLELLSRTVEASTEVTHTVERCIDKMKKELDELIENQDRGIRQLSEVNMKLLNERAFMEKLKATLKDCGTHFVNADTCGVCGKHFHDCEELKSCEEIEVLPSTVSHASYILTPSGFACPGARARALLASEVKP
jgi:hypothetical protein